MAWNADTGQKILMSIKIARILPEYSQSKNITFSDLGDLSLASLCQSRAALPF